MKARNFIIAIGSVAAVTTAIVLTSNNQKNYYFSNEGDDNNSGSINSPYKSDTKLNSVIANANEGDSIFLNRGDTFYGSINITKSNIVITGYGEGENPVLSGFTSVTNWTPLGNNLYESNAIPNGLTDLNLVTVSGVVTGMGRYPNLSEANAGYLTIDSYNSTKSITDASLLSSPGWTNADVVIRSERWVLDRKKITSHSGHTINYSGGTTVPKLGYGYFIENSPKTLDKQNEWYWNPSTKKLLMYSVNGQPKEVKVSTKQNIITTAKSDIKLIGLTIEGANDVSVSFTSGVRNWLHNVIVNNSGNTGIYIYNSTDADLQKVKVLNSLTNGIDLAYGSSNTTLKNFEIKNTYPIAGMGGSGQGKGMALNVKGAGTLVEGGEILNSGFIGIYLGAVDNITIQNNLIDTYCFVKDDGAGIYAWTGGNTRVVNSNRIVRNNIILNGIGAIAGQPNQTGFFANSAFGIYSDVNSSDIIFSHNYLKNNGRAAIYLRPLTNHVQVIDNTAVDNQCMLFVVRDGSRDCYSNIIKNNVLFATGSEQLVRFENYVSSAKPSIGVMDSNAYVSSTRTPFSTKSNNYTFSSWQTSSGFDRNSTQIVLTSSDVIKPVHTAEEAKTIDLESHEWRDARNTKFRSLLLNPYEGTVLIRGEKIDTVVIPPVDTNKVILSSNNTTFSAPAKIILTAATNTSVKVEFLFNSKHLYTDAISPFSCTWSNVPRGTYSMTAKGTDKDGKVTISNSLNITVQ